jgi:ligand-binding SRPBCC domain-containing protein
LTADAESVFCPLIPTKINDDACVRVREFKSEILLPKPIDEVFAFFSDACNLQLLTPPWVHFQILTPCPIQMRPGALIDYRIRIRGIPIRWRTRITEWQPPHRFVDEQLRGPYRQWIHEHTFEARGQQTLARDHVRYAAPLDFLFGAWVTRDVQRIFAYRTEILLKRFR